MKLSLRSLGAVLCALVLAPTSASRIKQGAGALFHPKHRGAHKQSRHAAKAKAPAREALVAQASTVRGPAAKQGAMEAPHRVPPAVGQASPVAAAPPAVVQAPPVAAAAAAPPVPPVERNADGVPQLPAVSSMLGTAAETLKRINSQANTLEARVVQTQMEDEARMARQKAVFEQKLKEQEVENRGITTMNAGISQEIGKLKQSNAATEKHAKELQATNRMMRGELTALKAKLTMSREFLDTTMLSTDDSKAADLEVLQDAHTKKQQKQHKDGQEKDSQEEDNQEDEGDDGDDASGDSDNDNDSRGTSFLALTSSTGTAVTGNSEDVAEATEAFAQLQLPDAGPAVVDPRDILKVLSTGVDSLEKEERASEAKLKDMFLSGFRDGTHRRKALLLQQKQLNATRGALLEYQGKLQAAEAHLQGTRSHLEQRLKGLGWFLEKLAHVALGPPAEATRGLQELPASVIVPDGTQAGAGGDAVPAEGAPATPQEA